MNNKNEEKQDNTFTIVNDEGKEIKCPEEENPVLLPIETDDEWKLIEGILASLSNPEENSSTD